MLLSNLLFEQVFSLKIELFDFWEFDKLLVCGWWWSKLVFILVFFYNFRTFAEGIPTFSIVCHSLSFFFVVCATVTTSQTKRSV